MTSNLKYTLTANSTAIGVNHSTNEIFTFNTGSVCGGGNTNAACIMNGNTAMSEDGYSGYKYSWYAATAGTGTSSTVGEPAGSICPKGWRLPANYTTSATKSFGALTQAYLGFHEKATADYTATLKGAPLSLQLAGYYANGEFMRGGVDAIYWSSTGTEINSVAYGTNLRIQSSYTDPQEHLSKWFGVSVRCVAQ